MLSIEFKLSIIIVYNKLGHIWGQYTMLHTTKCTNADVINKITDIISCYVHFLNVKVVVDILFNVGWLFCSFIPQENSKHFQH